MHARIWLFPDLPFVADQPQLDGSAARHAPGFLEVVPLCAERNGLTAGVGVVEADGDAYQGLKAGWAVVDHQFDGGESGVAGGCVFAIAHANQGRAVAALQCAGARLAWLQAFDNLGGIGLADRRRRAVVSTVVQAFVLRPIRQGADGVGCRWLGEARGLS